MAASTEWSQCFKRRDWAHEYKRGKWMYRYSLPQRDNVDTCSDVHKRVRCYEFIFAHPFGWFRTAHHIPPLFNRCSQVLMETGFIFIFVMTALLIESRIRKIKTRCSHSKKTYGGDSTNIILDVAVEEKSAFIPGHDTRNTSYGTIV